MRTPALLAAALALVCVPAHAALADSGSGSDLDSTPPQHAQLATVPPSGVLTINGHGWGHGHGVSQWGAEGGAEQGQTSDAMLSAYYPGTVATTTAARTLRVWLSSVDPSATAVWASDGLAAVDLAGARVDAADPTTPTTLPTGAAYARWRVTKAGSKLALQSSPDGSTWTTYAPFASVAGPVRLSDSAQVVRVALGGGTSRDYRGAIAAVGGSSITTVDVVDLEDYLRGVVPRESPSSWLNAALEVQAVAARTYATYESDHAASGSSYDICDSDACQVYGGYRTYTSSGSVTTLETPSTDQAIANTAHVIRTYQGKSAFTQFSSSNGGWTSAGSQPYLDAHADPWDGVDSHNTGHSWSATLTADEVEARYPSVGTLTSVEVTQRDGNGEWGGRISKVLLHGVSSSGAATTVQATGYGIYQAHTWPAAADGLRSEWWQIAGAADTVFPASQPPGLQPVKPTSVLETARTPIKAGTPRRVPLRGVPAGATAVLVNVVTKAGKATTGSLMVGANGGRQVAAAALSTGKTSTGQVLVPVSADRRLVISVSRGSAGARVQVVGAVVPGGAVLNPVSPLKALPVTDGQVTLPTTASTALLGVVTTPGTTVTVGGVAVVGTGSVVVSPDTSGNVTVTGKVSQVFLLATPGALTASAKGVATMLPRAVTASVNGHPSRVTVPGASAGSTVLLHVFATTQTKVWPSGAKGPMVTFAPGTQALLVLTLKDARVLVQTLGATGSVTLVPLATLSRS